MESTSISKSSQGLKEFLEETHLSKKELANMIGVTLSYVYNLANENAPFTRRKDTLERLRKEGYIRVRINGEMIDLSEDIDLEKIRKIK